MTLPKELLPNLPDSARLWVFGVGRPFSAPEEAALLAKVDLFIRAWAAHGHPLAASREWVYGRFLLLGVDDRVAPPSGCSIDALVHMLRDLEGELGTEIVGGASVWYRNDGREGEVRRVSRPEFRSAAAAGRISEDTVVFDLSITRVGELREGKWETVARDSWHSRYLDGARPSTSAR
jgi:hypothetical protein